MGGCFTKRSTSAVLQSKKPAAGSQLVVLQQFNSLVPLSNRTPVENPVIGRPYEDVELHYTIGEKLGKGEFATIFKCTEKSTGRQFACKSISKSNIKTNHDENDIRREIQIMKRLSGQPTVVDFMGAYEDVESVHVVMEFCAGGDLFRRIKAKRLYGEREAASIFRAITSFVNSCHALGVMHRDIKPENFLFSIKDKVEVLKATDFGVSTFIEKGKVYQDVVGSPYYVAPEVLQRNYGKEADIWSAGVVLYVLLCGVPPFWAETQQGIFDAIMVGVVPFDVSPWATISSSAKDLVLKMLTHDPAKRITPAQVLEHPWIREGGVGIR